MSTTDSGPAWVMNELETPRLRLRRMIKGDEHGLLEVFSDEETLRYWSGVTIGSLEEARKLLEREFELVENESAMTWAVADPESDRLMGKFTLFNFSEQNRRAEVGYILGRQYWGKGYMSEVMERLIRYAFDELGLHRLEADTDPANASSLALLDKFGFQREGLFRDRWLINGRWYDSVMLGLIND